MCDRQNRGVCDRKNIETGGTDAMRTRILIEALVFALLAAVCATVGPAIAQAPAQPNNAGPVQPWGLPPLPPGVGPIEKFADISSTLQGKFLEGGSFDDQGNLWFVGIGSEWISYLQPDGKLVPVVNCNPPAEIGQTCEPQGTRFHDGKLYLTTRHRGILVYDPQTKELKTLVYTWRNQLFKGPTTSISTPRATSTSPIRGRPAPDRTPPTAPEPSTSIQETACCGK
jgi:hypothetical protein